MSFPTDSDDFLSQECPACEGRFKVVFGEGCPEPISHCPYCGHIGRDCWWTLEQAEYINAVQTRAASDLMDSELKKMARKFNQRSGSGLLKLSMTTKRTPTPTPREPVEDETDMPIFEFACCGERIKHDGSETRLHCVICGTEHTL